MTACAHRAFAFSIGTEHNFYVVVLFCCIPMALDTIVPCVFLFCDAHTVYMA